MHPYAIIYIILALYSVAIVMIGKKNRVGNKEYIFIAISFLLLMFFHIFVDVNSVEDLPNYRDSYRYISQLSFSKSLHETSHDDYSWAILNKLTSVVSSDFVFLLLLYNILLLITIYLISKKYSPYIPVSIVIFFLIAYDQSLFVLRQYLAIACILWTIPCIINKKLLPYIALCIVASFFHHSAIIWVPIYFLCIIKNKKLYIVLIAVATAIIAYVCSNPLVLAVALDDYYINTYLDTGESQNMTSKLISLSYLVCYVVFVKRHIFDEGINKLCFNTLFIYAVVYFFAPPIGLISRLLKYFEIFLFLVVPITMSYMKNQFVRILYFSLILILQGFLFIRGLDEFWISDYRLDNLDFKILVMIVLSLSAILFIFKKDDKRISCQKLTKKCKRCTNDFKPLR